MKTWKKLLTLTSAAALCLGLAACSGGSKGAEDGKDGKDGGTVTLKVGASPSPHAVILQYVQDNLAKKAGLNLEIVKYTDYVQPNVALNDGELDANYYQTVPYLEEESKKRGYQFEHGKGIHLEPLGIYSEQLKDVKQLKDGDSIGIINDVTNQARALKLLADNNLIKLPKEADQQTVAAIQNSAQYNPHKYKFQEAEGPQLVRALADVKIGVINGNFALDGGKKPSDALALEKTEGNPSLNILAWKKDGKQLEAVKKLDELLHSPEVKAFIAKEYADKSVIPGF